MICYRTNTSKIARGRAAKKYFDLISGEMALVEEEFERQASRISRSSIISANIFVLRAGSVFGRHC